MNGQRPFAVDPKRWHLYSGGALIVLAALIAYHTTFNAPFTFDDQLAIVDNPSIRHLTAWREVFSPPPGTAGAVGRPFVNFSFALNYAWGELDVSGYHAVNLFIHALAGLTLFGLLRRTFEGPSFGQPFAPAGGPLS